MIKQSYGAPHSTAQHYVFSRHSQAENEVRTIAAVSADGQTLTLTQPLNYTHLGVTITLPDGTAFQARAEVGVLTRNIVVRGSQNQEWNDNIAACPNGFNTGTVLVQHQLYVSHYCKTMLQVL